MSSIEQKTQREVTGILKQIRSIVSESDTTAFKARNFASAAIESLREIDEKSDVFPIAQEAIIGLVKLNGDHFDRYRKSRQPPDFRHGNDDYFWRFITGVQGTLETVLYKAWGIES